MKSDGYNDAPAPGRSFSIHDKSIALSERRHQVACSVDDFK